MGSTTPLVWIIFQLAIQFNYADARPQNSISSTREVFEGKVGVVVFKIPILNGTNDDVSLKICSDVEPWNCCSTDDLDRGYNNNFSRLTTKASELKYLGQCQNKEFKVNQGLEVTLSVVPEIGWAQNPISKSDTFWGDTLIVDMVDIYLKNNAGVMKHVQCNDFGTFEHPRGAKTKNPISKTSSCGPNSGSAIPIKGLFGFFQ